MASCSTCSSSGRWRTAPRDHLSGAATTRFTRLGRVLASTRLDGTQLFNVLLGQMSLVGPRPEDPAIVERDPDLFAEVMTVRPGITGLSQLAFAKEAEILDPTDRMGHYRRRILPQKLALDGVYVTHRTLWKDIKILMWTAAAFFIVGVHRGTGVLRRRRRNAMETPPPQPNGRPRLRACRTQGRTPRSQACTS